MASNKKKKGVKGKKMDLQDFLAENEQAPSGYTFVAPRVTSWADTVENEDERYSSSGRRVETGKIVLPTAPKASRGPSIDVSKLPDKPPYTVYLGNLPFEVTEDDVIKFFKNLQVGSVRLPKDQGNSGRMKGFGYAEFNDKQSLIEALNMDEETMKGRTVNVSLAAEQEDRGGRGGNRGGPDRTMGDWRSARAPTASSDDSGSSNRYGGFGEDRRGGGSRGFDNYHENRRDGGGFGDRRAGEGFGDRREGGFRDYERRNGGGFERRENSGFRDKRDGGGSNREGWRDGPRGFTDRRQNDSYQRDTRSGGNRYEPPRDRYVSRGEDEEKPAADVPAERPKLQLAPRTKPVAAQEPAPAEKAEPPKEKKEEKPKPSGASIFGGAKPVDTAAREREIEERLARERADEEHRAAAAAATSGGGDAPVLVRTRKTSSSSGGNRRRESSESADEGYSRGRGGTGGRVSPSWRDVTHGDANGGFRGASKVARLPAQAKHDREKEPIIANENIFAALQDDEEAASE